GAVAFNFAYLLAMALLLSVSPVVAQAVGGGRHEVAARALRHGLVLAVAIAVPLSLVVAYLAPVLGRLVQDAAVLVGANECAPAAPRPGPDGRDRRAPQRRGREPRPRPGQAGAGRGGPGGRERVPAGGRARRVRRPRLRRPAGLPRGQRADAAGDGHRPAGRG